MRPDIVNLRQFYSSLLGRRVKACLHHMVTRYWPNHFGSAIIGIGYTLPVLRAMERHSDAAICAVMPAVQGAIYWPVHAANRSILTDETCLPFAVNSISRAVVMHALEYHAKPDEMLRSLWQALEPGGQVLLIVPNRRGIWARFGRTPFCTGTPYTLQSISHLLAETEFTLRETSTALFAPPSSHPVCLRLFTLLEGLGRALFPYWGGVLVIEAEKQIYAGVGQRVVARSATPSWQPTGATAAVSTSRNSRTVL